MLLKTVSGETEVQESNAPWYILQTKPNYEAKVIQGITKLQAEGKILGIANIFSPEDLIVEYKDGKKKERMKKRFSNYLYIQMDYSDEIWHLLKPGFGKGINGVVAFLGLNKTKPTPVPRAEIEKLMKEVSGETPKPKIIFEIGTNVRIISGSFAEYNGVIASVDYEKNKVKVEVSIFGRPTPVDLELNAIVVLTD